LIANNGNLLQRGAQEQMMWWKHFDGFAKVRELKVQARLDEGAHLQ
jgi:hypothetical protein